MMSKMNGDKKSVGGGMSTYCRVSVALLVSFVIAGMCSNMKLIKQIVSSGDWDARAVVSAEHVSKTIRAADGCYHVFLDVGANIGVHGRFLLEPEKYPEEKEVTEIFNKYFGSPRDNRDLCTFEFEPNPNHHAALERNSKSYEAVGWRYHVMNVGVSDKDGSMTFYHQGNDVQQEEWAFSVKKFNENATSVTIPMIRLAAWVEQHVNQRIIPSKPYGDYGGHPPTVVMKMDIEGSEYIVLPDLMMSGAICGIDFIFCEFHASFAPLDFPGSRIPLQNSKQAGEAQNVLFKALASSRNCKSAIANLDSEKYLHDGMPLPEPSGIAVLSL